jgi:hypothetical protein
MIDVDDHDVDDDDKKVKSAMLMGYRAVFTTKAGKGL